MLKPNGEHPASQILTFFGKKICKISVVKYSIQNPISLKVNKSAYIASHTYQLCWQYAIMLPEKSDQVLNQLNQRHNIFV